MNVLFIILIPAGLILLPFALIYKMGRRAGSQVDEKMLEWRQDWNLRPECRYFTNDGNWKVEYWRAGEEERNSFVASKKELKAALDAAAEAGYRIRRGAPY